MSSIKKPPVLPLKFFRWFIHPDYQEDIEGDLVERFDTRWSNRPKTIAQLKFTIEILKLIRPSLIRPFEGYQKLNYFGMLTNHIKIAVRIFRRDKLFTGINILGLALGIACTLLTYYWIQDEFSYDRFHEKGDQLYRVMMNLDVNGMDYVEESTAYPLADALKEGFPEVLQTVRYSYAEEIVVTLNDQISKQLLAFADPNFFETFSYPMLEGDARNCLNDPTNIVISKKLAEAYYEDKPAIGERITVQQGPIKVEFLVSGVFEDIPRNSSVKFDLLIPTEVLLSINENMESWDNPWFATYVTIDPKANLTTLSDKIKDLPLRKAEVDWYSLIMQKYEDQYLYGKFENGKVAGGRIDNIILFAIIAAFTLIISFFNYINLTTARSIKRDKEICIRKTLGA